MWGVNDDTKPSCPIGGAARDDGILELSFLVFSR